MKCTLPTCYTLCIEVHGSSKCARARACVSHQCSVFHTRLFHLFIISFSSFAVVSLLYLSVCLFCYSLAVAGFDLLLSAIYSGLCGVLIFTILCVCVDMKIYYRPMLICNGDYVVDGHAIGNIVSALSK